MNHQSEEHERKCHDCGNVAMHEKAITPYVLCSNCGSQDTRRTKRQQPKQIDDGGPAFPTKGSAHEICNMTMRDYFSAHAISVAETYAEDLDDIGKIAYEIADQLIEARKQQ